MSAEPEATVTCEFKVAAPGMSFTAQATVPAGQTTLTRILPVLQNLDDAIIGGVVSARAEEGIHVSCKAGCGACCRQMVPLSIFEAELLAEWIHSLPEARQRALAERFDGALKALAASGILERILEEKWLEESEGAHSLGLEYFRKGVPCPFLEEESCSIHPIRPLVCREFLISSPPERCADPTLGRPEPIDLPVRLSRALMHIGARLEGDRRGWIPLVFLFAWMKSGVKPGDYVAGEGPELLRTFLSHMKLLSDSQEPEQE